MNRLYAIALSLFALSFVTPTAQADHGMPVGSSGYVVYETRELNDLVQRSWLRYHVKSAVSRFAWDVEQLGRCVQAGRPIFNDHLEDPGVPHFCRHQLNQARRSFSSVDRYLWDTHYDFPRIYRVYANVRNGLNRL